jgi:LysR family transcriptional regulator, cell division regulator
MDVGDLKVFEAVARLGGMNRAAAELHTVQSNVTARIRLLEEELGAALFERHSRGVSLTAAGERLLPYALKLQHLLDEARRAFADTGQPAGRLTLGSLETTAALRLSPVLSAYVAHYPEVDLVLRTGTTCELVADVLEHRLEGAFVCGPVDHAELDERTVFREELAIVTAPAVTSLEAALSRPDLKAVVLRAGCSYRQRLEDILARRGIVGVRLLEFGTIEAIFACVAAGLGISLLPKSLVEAGLARVAAHPLPSADAVVDTVFIRRRDAFLSSALAAFMAVASPTPARAAAE